MSAENFTITGSFAGRETTIVLDEGNLTADPDVLERARLIAECDDQLTDQAGEPMFTASLDGPPIERVLTAMRALDRIWSIELRPANGRLAPLMTSEMDWS